MRNIRNPLSFVHEHGRLLFELFFIFLVGVLVAQGIIQATSMGGKWTKLLLLVLIGATGFLVIADKEKFLLYFSAFLLPINLTMHPFGYNTVPFYRALNGFQVSAIDFPLALVLLFCIIRLLWTKEKIQLYPWITFPYMLIVAFAITSWIGRSVEPVVKAGALFLLLKNPATFLFLANNLKNRRTVFIIIGILLLNGGLQSLIAAAQFIKGDMLGLEILGEASVFSADTGSASVLRVGGTIGHANKLALFLAFLIQINIAVLFIPTSSKIIKLFRLTTLLLMSSSIMLTYSRSAWASLILGGTINVYWCRSRKTKQKILSAILVISIMSGVALAAIGLVPSVRNRIFEDDGGSGLEIRHHLKVICKNIIRHNYWFGVGLNNYCSVIHKYDNSTMGASWHFPMPVHNEYMLVAAELGLPAGAIYILIFVLIVLLHISIGLNKKDPSYAYIAIGFLCGWTGWLLHHRTLYENAIMSHNIWFYLGIIMAIHNNLKHEYSPADTVDAEDQHIFSQQKNKLLAAGNSN
jgi:hypothetical protein